jgi:beta-mannanase
MVGFGNFWGEDYFPREQLQVIKDYGALPLVYWMPWGQPYDVFNGDWPAYALDTIIAGKYDDYIAAWGDSMKAWGKAVLVAFAPEMNGDLYPWAGDNNGGPMLAGYGDPTLPDGPERFVAAYRHVTDLVRSHGAKNVSWVFAPAALNFADEWNAFSSYYPGDSLVDWLGMVAFGYTPEDEEWISFDSLVGPAYAQLESLNTSKPMMLAKWGQAETGDPTIGSKPAWLDTAFTQIKAAYPRLKAAVCWEENVIPDPEDPETYYDYRIESSDSALTTYTNGVKDGYWLDRP